MRIVYIAHPIGGDVKNNLEAVRLICQHVTNKYPGVIAFAPYFLDCQILDDAKPEDRARGIRNNQEFFNRVLIDEVWLCGPRLSAGMQAEVELAETMGVTVVDKIGLSYEDI